LVDPFSRWLRDGNLRRSARDAGLQIPGEAPEIPNTGRIGDRRFILQHSCAEEMEAWYVEFTQT